MPRLGLTSRELEPQGIGCPRPSRSRRTLHAQWWGLHSLWGNFKTPGEARLVHGMFPMMVASGKFGMIDSARRRRIREWAGHGRRRTLA